MYQDNLNEEMTLSDMIELSVFGVLDRDLFHKKYEVEKSEVCDITDFVLFEDESRRFEKTKVKLSTKTLHAVFSFDYFRTVTEGLKNSIKRAWLVKSYRMLAPCLVLALNNERRAILAPLAGVKTYE